MKNIVVIGGNQGVGFQVVKNCISRGYNVAVCFREDVESFPFGENDKLILQSFDLQNISQCKRFIERVTVRWQKIDGIVFYAGITPISPLTDCTEELFDNILDINLKSTFFLTQAVVKNMMEYRGGSIVFFGTSHMESGQIDRAAYAISKGGIKILAEHLSRRYAKFQIRANIIVMGWTPTEGELALRASLGQSEEELIAQASEYVPMGRMLTVYDPVPAVMYFLSEDSCMVTGSTIRVNGGEYI
jgi:NAD(P)-dependent dehydrogenase (short-subunit alcohol dehydrogenase family)